MTETQILINNKETEKLINLITQQETAIAKGEDVTKFYSQPDYDLGAVLRFVSGNVIKKHELLYSDGTKKILSFDEEKQNI